jgi:hypothetical protein
MDIVPDFTAHEFLLWQAAPINDLAGDGITVVLLDISVNMCNAVFAFP